MLQVLGNGEPSSILTAQKDDTELEQTGWRCGCAAGPEWIVKAIGKLSTNDEACTSHPVQWAALAAVTDPSAMEAFRETQAVLRRRRDLVLCHFLIFVFKSHAIFFRARWRLHLCLC